VDNEEFKASEYVLVLARVWIYMALGALILYFVLKTLESRPTMRIHVTAPQGYHVPVEHEDPEEDEVPRPLKKEVR